MKRSFNYISLMFLFLIINDLILAIGRKKYNNFKETTEYWEKKLNLLKNKFIKIEDIGKIEYEKKIEMRKYLEGKI
jgi:hypothetical protein